MAKRILLVDDEPILIKGLKFTLEKDGYETLTAYDGEEALQVFHNNHVDLVLLDVMLPKLDGIVVCQRIRETSNVPIIMLTAKGEDMDKILGLEYGADDYMTKPFNILEVKARIKSILRRTGQMNRSDARTITAPDPWRDLLAEADALAPMVRQTPQVKERTLRQLTRKLDGMLAALPVPYDAALATLGERLA